jgi:hypothetical protein
MNISRGLSVLLVASGTFLPPMAAEAVLVAYDGLDYAPSGSELLGKAGGFGFSTAWRPGGFNASNHTNYDIQGGSLSFGSLLNSGNRVQTGAVGAIAGLIRIPI